MHGCTALFWSCKDSSELEFSENTKLDCAPTILR